MKVFGLISVLVSIGLACVLEEPSIVFGDSVASNGSGEFLVCKVIAINDCKAEPVLTLLSTTGEKVEILPYFKENYAYTPSEDYNYTRSAYFFKLEDIELDREYQWSVQATNHIGPFSFKYRDKDEYNRFDYIALSTVDVSNKSLHLFKFLEATDWKQYDALILNGNAALNLEDSNGFVGDNFFKSLGPISSKVPFIIQAGDRDMVDEGKMLNFRFLMPGRSPSFGNNLFHFTQGSSMMVFINPNYFRLLNDSDKSGFIDNLRSILKEKQKDQWLIAFISGPQMCFKGENCTTQSDEVKAIFEVLSESKVSLILHSQIGVYKKVLTANNDYNCSTTQFNPRNPNYVNGLTTTVHVVYGISGNSIQNISNVPVALWNQSRDSLMNISLPEESFLKLSIRQLKLEVFLVDARTNTTLDTIAIFRPSTTLISHQQSSPFSFSLFLASPMILLCIMMLPRLVSQRELKALPN